mmetsp:Transcript_20034/g.49836  ORF Transcript_20034/g.49836 Transcript_20034/m.49836 type:complete len:262 (+) Transcript_20034:821-1606(+)
MDEMRPLRLGTLWIAISSGSMLEPLLSPVAALDKVSITEAGPAMPSAWSALEDPMRTMPFMFTPDAMCWSAAATAFTATASACWCSAAVPGSSTCCVFPTVSSSALVSNPSSTEPSSREMLGSLSSLSSLSRPHPGEPADPDIPAAHGCARALRGVSGVPGTRCEVRGDSAPSPLLGRHGRRECPRFSRDHSALERSGVAPADAASFASGEARQVSPASAGFLPTRSPRSAFAAAPAAAAASASDAASSLAYRCGAMPRWP